MEQIALEIIRHAFSDKKDKGGHPYIEHLRRVAERVPNIGDGKIKTAALLHDILEDCPQWNETSLGNIFHRRVVMCVVSLTRKNGQSYDDYITQVLADGWATIIKKADLEDNMDITRLKSLDEKDFERLKKYHAAYLRITREIPL